jgi:hypothetical protein
MPPAQLTSSRSARSSSSDCRFAWDATPRAHFWDDMETPPGSPLQTMEQGDYEVADAEEGPAGFCIFGGRGYASEGDLVVRAGSEAAVAEELATAAAALPAFATRTTGLHGSGMEEAEAGTPRQHGSNRWGKATTAAASAAAVARMTRRGPRRQASW